MSHNQIQMMTICPMSTDSQNCWIVQESGLSLIFYFNPAIHGPQSLELLPAAMEKFAADLLTKQK